MASTFGWDQDAPCGHSLKTTCFTSPTEVSLENRHRCLDPDGSSSSKSTPTSSSGAAAVEGPCPDIPACAAAGGTVGAAPGGAAAFDEVLGAVAIANGVWEDDRWQRGARAADLDLMCCTRAGT